MGFSWVWIALILCDGLYFAAIGTRLLLIYVLFRLRVFFVVCLCVFVRLLMLFAWIGVLRLGLGFCCWSLLAG